MCSGNFELQIKVNKLKDQKLYPSQKVKQVFTTFF